MGRRSFSTRCRSFFVGCSLVVCVALVFADPKVGEFASTSPSSFCGHNSLHGDEHFGKREHVYVAHAENLDTISKLIAASKKLGIFEQCDNVVSVVGGLSILHLLSNFAPGQLHSITWFDINCHALDQARLTLELLQVSQSREEYITNIFGRSLQEFLLSNSLRELTVDNQERYMELAWNETLVHEILRKLTPLSRRIYKENIVPKVQQVVRGPIFNDTSQDVLFPTLGASARYSRKFGIHSMPNVGSYDYGFGYLQSNTKFKALRLVLAKASHLFVQGSVFDTPHQFVRNSTTPFLYTSNVLRFWWMRQKSFRSNLLPTPEYKILNVWHAFEGSSNHLYWGSVTYGKSYSPLLSVITPFPRTGRPHQNLFYVLFPLLYTTDSYMTIVEIIKADILPDGMYEFPRIALSPSKYMHQTCQAHTTILHILVGEKAIAKEELLGLYLKARNSSFRVIVIEFNSESADFIAEPSGTLFSPSELMNLLPDKPNTVRFAKGFKDEKRNMVLDYTGLLHPSLPRGPDKLHFPPQPLCLV